MHRTRVSGFTLIELMVTIGIVAILLTIGLPSFQGSLRSNRVATGTNEVLASLALARTEAIRSTRTSVVCASADGSTCGANWNAGWIVWVDDNNNGSRDPSELVVRYVQAHPQLLIVATIQGGPTTGAIKFDSRGRVVSATMAQARLISLQPDTCPTGQPLVRTMTLTAIGQVNTATGNCS